MLGCSERQRVRGLLAEAINMLCKTSLKYKFGFSIEGLLGITIDNSQVLLINIQEEFKNKSWPDGSVVGKSPSNPLSNSPMDLSTTSHPKVPAVGDSVKAPTATKQSWYCPTPNTQALPDSRLSPEVTDVKPDVDLSLAEQPNGQRSTTLSNGQGRAKCRRFRLPNSRAFKREHSPLSVPKQHHLKPNTTTATSQPTTSSAAGTQLDLSDDDIIYIKDEDDSEDDCSQGVFSDPVAPHPIQLSLGTSKKRRNAPTAALPLAPKDSEASPESPVVVKLEEDSCSSGGPAEDGNHSPAWREDSPSEVTYEAGMWRSEDTIKTQSKRHKAGKGSHPANTTGDSAVYHQPTHVSPKNAKTSLEEVSMADTAPTASAAVLCSTSDQAVAVCENSSEQLLTYPLDHADVATAPTEEAESSAQAIAQLEGDHTEWPADLPRRPRASYSTAYKLMIVRKALESGNMRATARRFGIHFKQVWQWSRNKEKLLAMSLSALRSPRLLQQVEEERQARREKAEVSSASVVLPSESTSST